MRKVKVKRIKLDVLKPHLPNVLEFATGIGTNGGANRVLVRVVEVDDKTETLEVLVEGNDIEFDQLAERITELGGSLHSIDEVMVSTGGSDDSQ